MNSWKQADVLITKKKEEHTWKDDGTALEEKEKYLFHQ
ncbi:hypothetical protein NC652_019819 [Populus alba x Populus x berolinensis]|nr:hypothetical protein NC652_019819 [Populus alba x Populus x berolinensis]